MKIYADHAATTKMSDAAVNTLLCMSKEVWGNPSSLYEHGQKAKEVLEQAREDVASVINADPKEIYFTSGGSEADNQAILTAAEIGRKQGKKHIPCEVEDAIRDDTCLVTIMYANNEIGTIQPIREIGAVCRRKKVLFHTDAVQAVAHIPVDVKADNIDMLSSSAHKFHGPKGTGFLYCKKGIQLSNLIEGGAQERGKRAGTENVPGIAAMATALKEMDGKKMPAAARLTKLRDRLIEGLQQIPHSALNGDAKHRLPGNVNFCFEGIEGESLLLLLDDKGIMASSGSACTSGSLDPSHVLLAIGRIHDVAHGSLRLTLGEENTEEEVEYIIKSVKEVVEYLRGFSPVWRELMSGEREFIL